MTPRKIKEGQKMGKLFKSLILVLATVLISQPVFAKSNDAADKPWSKYSFQAGGFLSVNNSSVRFGSGVGIDVNMEELLGLDTSASTFRFDAHWRFTQNLHHKLDFSWRAMRRSGEKTLGNDFTIENPDDPDGPPIIIVAGTQIDSFMDMDIFKVTYSYSFFQDDRVDLAVRGGLYIMPISTGFSASGLVSKTADASFTAPLPVIGFQVDFAITPKWFLRTGTQIFYIEYQNFKGTLYSANSAIEFKAWKHVGFGLGVELLHLGVEAKGEDYPGIDFKGNINLNYTGTFLYVKAYF